MPDGWRLTLAASSLAGSLDRAAQDRAFAADADGGLEVVAADDARAVLVWRQGRGWDLRLPADDPRADLVALYLPICGATASRPLTIGHLGQRLDGFIATPSGDSRFVTGERNIVHLHGLRALCDAVVVGAGTVAADNPQLTTRLVPGAHPLRVVFDPERRLTGRFRIFSDPTALSLDGCERSHVRPGETHRGLASVVGIDTSGPSGGMGALLGMLRGRGAARIFVEGGGVTVSACLEAGLLDRLHIAVAPVLIGNGRPAIRLEAREHLRDCLRPGYRVFRMGSDVLFDCDLRTAGPSAHPPGDVSRII